MLYALRMLHVGRSKTDLEVCYPRMPTWCQSRSGEPRNHYVVHVSYEWRWAIVRNVTD